MNGDRDRRAGERDRRAGARDRRAEKRDVASAQDRRSAANDRRASSRDRRAAEDELAAAGIDELTGAQRRGVGFEALEREMARVRRSRSALVLAFIDVDGLKAINDRHGHAAGDAVLRAVADDLHRVLRPYDLVIRFGGDEFLCVIPDITMAEAADRLAGVPGVSVGLADASDDDDVPTLVQRADAELYRQRDTVLDLRAPVHSPKSGRRPI